ncbi:secreted RxLR effector protein 161-like [Raphanus sativus]|uniref:Secreted RxLR effector protein 161-like n=1 Tax=Raphanus sativus TaxID=3726 RepID=A0A9W3CL62_RAPSA|nr:secreted RxLR effector protein 161-like [Raphanus sativus]
MLTLIRPFYLLLYVDDMLIASGNKKVIKNLKEKLSGEFEMKDMGKASRILGMDITRDRMLSCDYSYCITHQIEKPHRWMSGKWKASQMERIPYASAVVSLMYAMVGSRPDLGFAVGYVCRFMSKPGREHLKAVQWVLRIFNSDYATDRDRSRSVTGYAFKFGGNTVSWKSCLQSVVALSTTEAEYMALNEAAKEAMWLKNMQ